MTNEFLTPRASELTPAADSQPKAITLPRVRHLAVIGTDGARFRIVSPPLKLTPQPQI